MIKVQIYPVTMLQTNCCYLVDEATGKAAVSDPGERSGSLEAQIDKDGGKLEYVLDLLFCESYGRTDLPSGDDDMMLRSLKRVKELDGDYTVVPGHGPLTTLSHERRFNPLMRRL